MNKPDRMTVLLDGVRASGGYRYRDHFAHVCNQDMPALIADCEAQLRAMARKLAIAETMLHVWAPWWESYQRQCGVK